jgi:predicted HAD superfamily Cof-like phosphohydrolase
MAESMDRPLSPESWTSVLEAVENFHRAFGIPLNHQPGLLSPEESVLRYSLMREENEEYLEATQKNDLLGVADALGDQLFVLCGTMLRHGLQDRMYQVFMEIYRSNMSKLDEQGNPIYREDGKVLKGPGYFRPNLRPFLPESQSE